MSGAVDRGEADEAVRAALASATTAGSPTYQVPSKSRQEMYGDDMLVHAVRSDTMFRATRAMPWDDFYHGTLLPWVSSDPDFDASKLLSWTLVGEACTPDGAKSLEENGVKHKNCVTLIGA